MSTPESERRAHQRYPAADDVRIVCHRNGSGDGPNLAVALLDASQSGVRLFLNAPVEPGEAVRLGLEVDGLTEPVRLAGVVRWAVDREDGTCIAGVELERLIGERDLERLTENLWD